MMALLVAVKFLERLHHPAVCAGLISSSPNRFRSRMPRRRSSTSRREHTTGALTKAASRVPPKVVPDVLIEAQIMNG
jgi:hypothetical protein